MKRVLTCLLTLLIVASCGDSKKSAGSVSVTPNAHVLKVLVWNIQNGMWSDQGNDYDNFVSWVKSQKPDVCIWCEAKSNYKTGQKVALSSSACYLPDGWGELAKRYGHDYWSKGGQRDNFPQVITSKYPIKTVNRIVGNGADSIVTHGAGHFQISLADKDINFVSLHTWPQKYAFGVSGTTAQQQSTAANGGDYYRLKEITYICEHTIGKAADPDNEWWLMAGDFNAQSVLDNDTYKYAPDDTRLLVHNYVLESTPYKDVIKEKYPGEFKTTTSGKSRIDFVYCSPAMMDKVTYADVVSDYWTGSLVKDEATGFKHPSDHRPILLYINIPKK